MNRTGPTGGCGPGISTEIRLDLTLLSSRLAQSGHFFLEVIQSLED